MNNIRHLIPDWNIMIHKDRTTGGWGKAAHSPQNQKNSNFFGQIFWLRFFYTKPREAWVRSHTSCVDFFFCRCCHIRNIYTLEHSYTSVTYLDIFTQSVTSTLQYLGDCQNLSKRFRPDLDQSKPGLNLV